MVRAFKLYTGADKASHVLEGTIDLEGRTDVIAIHFKETPAHSSSAGVVSPLRRSRAIAAICRTPKNCRSPSDAPTITGTFWSVALSKTAFNVIKSETLK